jgi:hypothetical protein
LKAASIDKLRAAVSALKRFLMNCRKLRDWNVCNASCDNGFAPMAHLSLLRSHTGETAMSSFSFIGLKHCAWVAGLVVALAAPVAAVAAPGIDAAAGAPAAGDSAAGAPVPNSPAQASAGEQRAIVATLAARRSLTDEGDGASLGGTALDDIALSHQRGGRPGMLTIAATPQSFQGGVSVTLWDEIAPPTPAPVPADASRTAQGNTISFTRK